MQTDPNKETLNYSLYYIISYFKVRFSLTQRRKTNMKTTLKHAVEILPELGSFSQSDALGTTILCKLHH